MKKNILIRRLHVYTSLFLVMFFLKYGISAIFYSHSPFFQHFNANDNPWIFISEQPYSLDVSDTDDLKITGAQIMEVAGFTGSFGCWIGSQNNIIVNKFSFLNGIRLTYNTIEHKLMIEKQAFRLNTFLQKFHWIGGYQQNWIIADIWAFMIDCVCIGMLLWVISGLHMWWQQSKLRVWGIITLFSGCITFIFFVIVL